MRSGTVLPLILVLAALCSGQTPTPAARAPQTNPNPLPADATPEELLLPPLPVEGASRAAPTGVVYCPPEYAPCAGMFIAWDGYEPILAEMTTLATTNDPNVTVWVVVDSSSEQTTAYNYLNSAGASMTQVEFITRTTDSVWIRDYGPRFIFEDGNRAVVDHTYNRPRPNDNLFNDYLCTLWNIPQYQIPLTHGGGNFHLFANGDAFMSSLILTENPSYTEQQIKDLYRDYQNLNLTIYPGFPTSFDSTQHIDMWMMPAGDSKVIIGDYHLDNPGSTPVTITDNAAADMTARGYTVYRVRGWNTTGTHYTYTNSVVLNNQVFMPSFGGSYASQDAAALAVFQSAFPGYSIHQINCASIIGAAGALHCIMMHTPAYAPPAEPVVNVVQPDGGELCVVGQTYNIAWTATDDVAVTSIDLYLSTDGGATFPFTIATGEANDGLFEWTVPNDLSAQCRIKVVAWDADLNSGEDVSAADFTISLYGPEVLYDFPLDTNPGWTCEGDWAWGVPAGAGGAHGGPDPDSGYTGDNVYGYNLLGDYAANLPQRNLTSAALDLTGATDTKLAFWRWLGVEGPSYDHAYVRVSNDGTTWANIWQNTAEVADSAWTYQEFDISAVADNQPTVYLRWTMGPVDGSWNFCGWNLDDIQVIGIPSAPAVCAGDCNCDGEVGFSDINSFVSALLNQEFCDGAGANADLTADDPIHVGFEDINPFVDLLTGNSLPIACP